VPGLRYETAPVRFAEFAPSNGYVREVDDLIHWISSTNLACAPIAR
jgi:hypothetical protein